MSAIVIVGAGECGTRAAFALREEGWDGPIVLVGTEPPYERPPLSKTGEYKLICGGAALSEAGITFLAGVEVTRVDTAGHAVELADGRRLPYGSLLLATGARARRLPIGGAPVHVLRSHADSAALRARLAPGRRVAVIGGGFIGLELAASAAALGCRVTVIELGPRLMSRGIPAQVAAVMAERHVTAGVDIRCGTGVTGLAPAATGITITLAEGTLVRNRTRACPGSGATSTITPSRSPGWPARRAARSSGCVRTGWRSGSACRTAAGWSPPRRQVLATPWPGTSGWPRCS